jgi:hypothetical protein
MSAEFYGVANIAGVNRVIPPMPLLADDAIVQQPVDWNTLPAAMAKSATDFIAAKAASGEDFFLMVAPYQPHHPLQPSPAYAYTSLRGEFGDVVCELDGIVGSVMHALREHDLIADTLVHFTSGQPGLPACAISIPMLLSLYPLPVHQIIAARGGAAPSARGGPLPSTPHFAPLRQRTLETNGNTGWLFSRL